MNSDGEQVRRVEVRALEVEGASARAFIARVGLTCLLVSTIGCGFDVPLGFDDAGVCSVRIGGTGFDPSWNGCAPVVLDLGQKSNGGFGTNALALDGAGRVYLAGTGGQAGQVGRTVMVARLDESGALDPSFGRGGIAETFYTSVNAGHAVHLLADGRALVGGSGRTLGNEPIALVARFTAAGQPDTTFGSMNGVEKVGVPVGSLGECHGVVARADGKVFCTGTSWVATPGPGDGLVALLAEGGPHDTAYGVMGGRTIDFGGNELVGAGALLPGDAVLLPSAGGDLGLARLDPSGALDPSFTDSRSIPGRVRHDFEGGDDGCLSVLPLSDGSALCAGYATVSGARRAALIKVTSTGALEPTFGTGGKLAMPAPFSRAWAVAAWNQGFIVLGEAEVPDRGTAMALQLIDATGAVQGPLATLDLTPEGDSARAIARDRNGRWVISGVAGEGSVNNDLVVFRLIPEALRLGVQGCAVSPGPLGFGVILVLLRRRRRGLPHVR